jgi:ATP-dependent Clp protease ATP-binding subunit ClpA
MFERFTDKARQVLVVAESEAAALGHNFLGTEHLLLGLVRGDGVAARVLAAEGFTAERVRAAIVETVGPGTKAKASSPEDAAALASIGIDLDEVRAAVEETFGEGALDRAVRRKSRRIAGLGRTPFVPRAKKVLELSLREALSMKHDYIGTEHLLLAIVREGDGVAARILSEQIALPDLRTKVIDELSRLRPGA